MLQASDRFTSDTKALLDNHELVCRECSVGAQLDRFDLGKLTAGACLSIAFTAVVFGPLGFGRRYVDNLERNVRSTLEKRELAQVTVAVEHDPALRRIVVLSGTVPDRVRMSAIQISRNVPGVAQVRWDASRLGVGTSPQYFSQNQ